MRCYIYNILIEKLCHIRRRFEQIHGLSIYIQVSDSLKIVKVIANGSMEQASEHARPIIVYYMYIILLCILYYYDYNFRVIAADLNNAMIIAFELPLICWYSCI